MLQTILENRSNNQQETFKFQSFNPYPKPTNYANSENNAYNF